MEPLLFKFKIALDNPHSQHNFLYDENNEMIAYVENDQIRNAIDANDTLGTKSAKTDPNHGEDQKATLFYK